MLFNSIPFAFFLPIVFILYWRLAGKHPFQQNLLLLAASYFFYCYWDYRFGFLLLFSTALDYCTGLAIGRASDSAARKTWLLISIVINLGLLAFFKYYNFFIENFAALLRSFGYAGNTAPLRIILPLGISFYTFHGLSYVFDIYRKKIQPTRSFIDYAVFVSFFPLLIAGPIERAGHLLPQVQKPRMFDRERATDGLRQILWGFFKKMVIADGCARYVDMVYANSGLFHGSDLLLAAILFSFQIYADFSGYSDIAIGIGRLLGFDLLRNFAYPYFSRDIAEFWRRWHISLTSWFRDYLYIPLGGNQGGSWKKTRNIVIVFLVSAFWHGANWTFITWGAINALLFLPLLWRGRNRQHLDIAGYRRQPVTAIDLLKMGGTFAAVTLSWIFFRAESMAKALGYYAHLLSRSLWQKPQLFPATALGLVILFTAVEWMGREQPYAIARLGATWPKALRWAFYYLLILAIFSLVPKTQQFIYFQF